MLHRFAFSNFQSFKDRTEVSLVLDKRVPDTGWSRTCDTGQRVSTATAVIGANASGKTSILKAMAFIHSFVSHSFNLKPDDPLPYAAHLGSLENEPSEFEMELDFNGKHWLYRLRTTPRQVLHESLYVKRERMGYVFVRDWNPSSETYDIKQHDFGFLPSEARKVKPNASLISTAAQYGVALAKELASRPIGGNIWTRGRRAVDEFALGNAAMYFAEQLGSEWEMGRLLSSWDFGLAHVLLREQKQALPDGTYRDVWLPFGQHKTKNGSTFELPFLQESSGTQSAFVLLAQIFPALEHGGLVVIDEFENDLHPHMLEPILNLFASETTNPRKAQLLFTCHAVQVLNVLHKSQVMLIEKNEHNESSAWRLDSVEGVRSDDNFYAKYMAGAYGAVPQL